MRTDAATVIRTALIRLNEAENSLASLGVEGVIRRIDDVLAPNWEGGANGGPDHSRPTNAGNGAIAFFGVSRLLPGL